MSQETEPMSTREVNDAHVKPLAVVAVVLGLVLGGFGVSWVAAGMQPPGKDTPDKPKAIQEDTKRPEESSLVPVVCPIGSIVAWHPQLFDLSDMAMPEGGWVRCDGQKYKLDNGKIIKIPDLNGDRRFLRGGQVSGVPEEDRFQKHWHYLKVRNEAVPGHITGVLLEGSHGDAYDTKDATKWTRAGNIRAVETYDQEGMKAKTDPNETRPINVSVVWIMRVK